MAYRSSSTSRLPREILNLISRHGSSRQQVRVFSSSLSRWHPSPASLSRRLGFPDLPKFSARGRDIQVLNRPDQFYTFLLDGIRKAKRRIFLASLYIGKEETELIRTLHEALKANPSLELHIITDFLRSTREHPHSTSSASLVASLQASFPSQVHLSLYHTPALHGVLKRIVPKRYNEGWGLWHGKIYGFDDDIMLSGANLSKDYFTNRQDRYIVFKNHSPFADYLHEFVKLFGKLSYTIKGRSFALSNSGDSFDLEWKGSMESGKPDSEPVHDPRGYTDAAKQRINTFMSQWSTRPTSTLTPHLSTSETTSSTSLDTTIQPFLQMGQFDIKQETDIVIPALLQEIQGDPKLRLDWTSGYFSLRNSYKDGLLQASGPVHIVCASPQANGFYQSAGFSKYIPPAYTYSESRFWKAVKSHDKTESIEIKEWQREGWTYHSKGIWLSRLPTTSSSSQSSSNESTASEKKEEETIALQPYLTTIGSSNYGYRSAVRDIEINAVVQTDSEGLSKALGAEIGNIRKHATDKVDDELFKRKDRYVGPINRVAARIIADML